jgi:hypothetical protein
MLLDVLGLVDRASETRVKKDPAPPDHRMF